MPKIALPIANGFYKSPSLPISSQECVNWYPNLPQAPSLSGATLFGAPGISQLATTGEIGEVNRGAHVLEGTPYFVNGGSLYRLNRDQTGGADVFTVENLGAVAGSGRVSLADNGRQLCILSPGGPGYIFTENPDTLTEITDPDFRVNGDPQRVVFIDGFFLFTTDTKRFIVSAINDGLSYNGLDSGTAEADPDAIQAPFVYRNQLFIAGTETIEGFQNVGGADFPFVRTGVFIQKGIKSPFSIIEADNSFMFIGGSANESPAIWQFNGSAVVKVSTTAVESLVQQSTDEEIDQIFSWSYSAQGAYFVGFNLPGTTIVLDTVTRLWHERQSFNADNPALSQRLRANSLVCAYGGVLVGDRFDGRIGRLDLGVYTEYGRPISRKVSTQPFQNDGESFLVASLELTVESGVGDLITERPLIRMSRSTDGGRTFTDERSRCLGAQGEYTRRAIWRRLGRAARFEVFRFVMTDPVKPAIIELRADILSGR